MNLQPVTLTGSYVRLEPLSYSHLDDLTCAGADPELWVYMRYGLVTTTEKMRELIALILKAQGQGTDLPFATIHLATGQAVGMTRYLDIQPANRCLEIGGTWVSPAYQRTAVNTEAKLLMLRYAFEQLGVLRVQIKTDLRNTRSQAAIERLGAVREGVLRDHIILPDGVVRSSVYYSILAAEWPAVEQRLLNLLSVHAAKGN